MWNFFFPAINVISQIWQQYIISVLLNNKYSVFLAKSIHMAHNQYYACWWAGDTRNSMKIITYI